MKKFSSTLILLIISQFTFAQYQIGLVPRSSPDKGVYQKIGFTQLEIKYGSPSVNQRTVWGDLVPYDKVWRAGANNATTIEISSSITIEGKSLDSGKYALFLIPKKENKWTIIFSNKHQQWGAFKYSAEDDALRVEISPKKSQEITENLSYTIVSQGFNQGTILLNWEYLRLEIPFETNYLSLFEQQVEARANQQADNIKWIVYLQGAEHLIEIKSNEVLAMAWLNQAEKLMNANTDWNKNYYPRDYIKAHLYWTKAKLYALGGNYKTAQEYADKIKVLDNKLFYERKNESEEIDLKISDWKKK